MHGGIGQDRVAVIAALTRKTLWLSNWMIHHANHIRPNVDGVKVGGHQASSASMTAIMSALYFGVLRPEDRVAVKPHAAPVFHAIQYLFGKQSLDKLKAFRGFGGAQSYPVAHQGHRRRRYLDRLGRPRRRLHRLRLDDPGLCPRQTLGRQPAAPRAAWWRWSAMPNSTRAMSTSACSRAGSTACATPGGSSTTTARASMASSAKASTIASRRSSAPSTGTWSPSNTAPCSARAFAEPGGDTPARPGSMPAPTPSIRR